MTINLISDIHCPHKSFTPNFHFEDLKDADVLVIAGDFGEFPDREKILSKIKTNYIGEGKKFKHLVYCWGNHDYYITDHWWQKHHKDAQNSPTIDDNHIDIIDDCVFICSCMWSRIINRNVIMQIMNDYNYIKEFYPDTCNEVFDRNVNFILDNVDKYKKENKKIIVVTHHLPLYQLIDPQYLNNSNSIANEAFAVMNPDINKMFLESGVNLWLHGHSHQFMDTVINGIRFVRNPFGYDWRYCQEWKYTGFKYDNIITI